MRTQPRVGPHVCANTSPRSGREGLEKRERERKCVRLKGAGDHGDAPTHPSPLLLSIRL